MIAQKPPDWWQPVMKHLKEVIYAGPASQSTNEALFEAFRKIIAECVRAEFVPEDMTEKQARRFVLEITLIFLEMLKPSNFNRDDLADKFVALLESLQTESEAQ